MKKNKKFKSLVLDGENWTEIINKVNKTGDPNNANKLVEVLEETVKHDPTDSQTWEKLSFISMLKAQNFNCIEACKKVLEIDPTNKAIGRMLEVHEARYDKKKAISPQLPLPLLNANLNMEDAYYHLGNALEKNEQLDRAVEAWRVSLIEYERRLELTPNDKVILNNMGLLLVKLGNFRRAIEFLKRAIEIENKPLIRGYKTLPGILEPKIEPMENKSFFNLAWAYWKQGSYDEAIKTYRESIEINPKHGESWLGLTKLYIELSRTDKAIETCNKCLKYMPGYEEVLKLSKKSIK